MLTEYLGLPEGFAEHAEAMDHMLDMTQWFAFVLFLGWSFFFFYVLVKFWRGRGHKPVRSGVKSHASTHIEILVVVVEAVLLLGFAFPLWAERVDEFPQGSDVVTCRVIGYQYNWAVHYPGEDGIFGDVDPRLYMTKLRDDQLPAGITPEEAADMRLKASTYGLVPGDPNGADDKFESALYVPEGHPVVMYVTSRDVIHNVAIPRLRVGIDAIPGTEHRFHFTATQAGEYDIICGQLCGDGHAQMRGACIVVSAEEWAKDYAAHDDTVLNSIIPTEKISAEDELEGEGDETETSEDAEDASSETEQEVETSSES